MKIEGPKLQLSIFNEDRFLVTFFSSYSYQEMTTRELSMLTNYTQYVIG